ncbi:MAG: hypothetical protein KTR30_12030 [Saprospiraceae bacterium]|nr:hypothetical protein [Saprospiraceae bacterium]
MRKALQFAALFLLLIGLPAGSWYYLQKGLDYRLETMGQLTDHGDFKLLTSNTPDQETKASVRVINFLAADPAERAQQGSLLSKLYAQFDKREDFQLVTFVDSTLMSELDGFRTKYGLDEEPQCMFRALDGSTWRKFVQTYKEESSSPDQYIALVDLEGNIRNFYVQQEQEEVKDLVEHIALLLPMKKQNKPELRREIEK